jgi:hypothetical protein
MFGSGPAAAKHSTPFPPHGDEHYAHFYETHHLPVDDLNHQVDYRIVMLKPSHLARTQEYPWQFNTIVISTAFALSQCKNRIMAGRYKTIRSKGQDPCLIKST